MSKAIGRFRSTRSFGLTRRALLRGAAGTAGALLAAPAIHARSGATLRFISSETSAGNVEVLNAAFAEYEDKFGVEIILDSTPISGQFTKAMSAIKAGMPYDLGTQGYIANILQYANGGHIVPLTDMVKQYTWGRKADWVYKGENWIYPYDFNLVTNYYRKDLYDAKGLTPPTTWEQMLENSRALTEGKDGNIDVGGCVIPLATDSATNWASFGHLFAEEAEFYDADWNVVLDQGANLDKATRFLDLYASLYETMPPGMNTVSYAELMSLFVTGKVAHSLYSGRLVEALEARNPELADKFGIFPSPDSQGKKQALPYAFDGFIVFNTPQSEESLKFLRWFVDEWYIRWLHSAWMNFQPARMDIYEDPRWSDHPLIQKHWSTMMQMKAYISDEKYLINSIDMVGPELDLLPCKLFESSIMPEMLQSRVIGGMTSEAAVKAAADRMRALA